MLRDEDVDAAADQLAAFRDKDELGKILSKYEELIKDFRRLKSDYEEEREAREKYKQLARRREERPFSVVLVDGDGYVFHESFVDKKSVDGGNNAAHALHKAIGRSLRAKGLDGNPVMVRIYANIQGLSKALCRSGLVGGEARSLCPFVANFNRSYPLTEFVDAGTLKENADAKIRAMLQLYADNPQCKHIYFAACHDVGYISELTPYRGNADKFTLIRTSGVLFHSEFTKLGMNIEDLPGVFRTKSLDYSPGAAATAPTPPSKSASTFASVLTAERPNGAKSSGIITATTTTTTTNTAGSSTTHTRNGSLSSGAVLAATTPLSKAYKEERAICQFHKLGKCRYGDQCKLLHPDDGPDTANWRARPSSKASSASYSSLDAPVPTWNGEALDELHIPPGSVAVNRDDYRLDPYVAVAADAMQKLHSRIRERPLCNEYQLRGSCKAGDACEYDHSPLPDSLRPPMKALARSLPCTRRGRCRLPDCIRGHICQNPECKYRGGRAPCRFSHLAHSEDLNAKRFVRGYSTGSLDDISDNKADYESEDGDGVPISP